MHLLVLICLRELLSKKNVPKEIYIYVILGCPRVLVTMQLTEIRFDTTLLEEGIYVHEHLRNKCTNLNDDYFET